MPADPDHVFYDREFLCKWIAAPGKVVRSLDVIELMEDGELQYRVVSLEDGSIWRWEHDVSYDSRYMLPILVGLFTGVGLFVGIVLFLTLRVIARLQLWREHRRAQG